MGNGSAASHRGARSLRRIMARISPAPAASGSWQRVRAASNSLGPSVLFEFCRPEVSHRWETQQPPRRADRFVNFPASRQAGWYFLALWTWHCWSEARLPQRRLTYMKDAKFEDL